MTPDQSDELYRSAQHLIYFVWVFIGMGVGGCIIWLFQFKFYYDQGVKELRDNEIRKIAHDIWGKEGCPQGNDKEHWLKATEMWEEEHNRINRILTWLKKKNNRSK